MTRPIDRIINGSLYYYCILDGTVGGRIIRRVLVVNESQDYQANPKDLESHLAMEKSVATQARRRIYYS